MKTGHQMSMRNTAILLFDEVEVLDFAGPFEVFSVTNELNDYGMLNVYTVAREKAPVQARNGLSVNPDFGIKEARPRIFLSFREESVLGQSWSSMMSYPGSRRQRAVPRRSCRFAPVLSFWPKQGSSKG